MKTIIIIVKRADYPLFYYHTAKKGDAIKTCVAVNKDAFQVKIETGAQS